MAGFLTGLRCARHGHRHDAGRLRNLCDCGAPLLATYDLAAAGRAVRPGDLAGRRPDLWRYRELLPLPPGEEPVSLGEGLTPLLAAPELGRPLGLERLLVKDESVNPTGSFKARGMSVAVTMARRLGARELSLPSAGNAGCAAAAYAARAGLPVHVFIPRDTPPLFAVEAAALGARVRPVEGVITDAGRAMAEAARGREWFDLSTLKEPWRVEGKKTMGLELAEQLGWRLPDVVIYPTGGGTGIVGMWKAFEELEALGWIDGRRPRLYAVQSSGCAPIVRAFESGAAEAAPVKNPATFASGLRVPRAIGDFLILHAVRASGGAALAVDDEEIRADWPGFNRGTGIFAAPEGVAAFTALRRLVARGDVARHETIVLFNTGAGLKYADSYPRSAGGPDV